jgi:hypothetical protein
MQAAVAVADTMLVLLAAAMAVEQLLQPAEAVTELIKIPMERQAVLILVAVVEAVVTDQLQDKQAVLVLLLFVIQIVLQQLPLL